MSGLDGSQFMPVPAGTLRIVIAAKPDPVSLTMGTGGAEALAA